MLNFFPNYIPNKSIICNDKGPLWLNNKIKIVSEKKNDLLENYMTNGGLDTDYVRLQKVGIKRVNFVRSSKEKFYINLAKRLNDLCTASKTYWSIVKTFINGKDSYYSIIIGQHNLVLKFKEKANILNYFFVHQC